MQLDDYFDFQAPEDIRLKGSRIGIESVLYEYLHRCQTAEEIGQRFPTLSLEQIYATILYYLHNKEAVFQYLTDWIEHGRRMRAQQPPASADFLERMRRAKMERDARRRVSS